ncbi:MAG: glutaredoxin family protein [Desulfobacteraceae bacterium]|nr:MAG: glutaredoxin family protein [Desulfobacteraceae bacterium]
MTECYIKLYALSTCSHCKSTRRLLDEYDVIYEYEEVDLLEGDERKSCIKDIKEVNPRCSFPTLVIKDRVIVGFKEDEILQALDATR